MRVKSQNRGSGYGFAAPRTIDAVWVNLEGKPVEKRVAAELGVPEQRLYSR